MKTETKNYIGAAMRTIAANLGGEVFSLAITTDGYIVTKLDRGNNLPVISEMREERISNISGFMKAAGMTDDEAAFVVESACKALFAMRELSCGDTIDFRKKVFRAAFSAACEVLLRTAELKYMHGVGLYDIVLCNLGFPAEIVASLLDEPVEKVLEYAKTLGFPITPEDAKRILAQD